MKNPIIPDYHADPFVYRHGDDFYMVQTTEDATGTAVNFTFSIPPTLKRGRIPP